MDNIQNNPNMTNANLMNLLKNLDKEKLNRVSNMVKNMSKDDLNNLVSMLNASTGFKESK